MINVLYSFERGSELEYKSEVPGVKVASCAMIGDEVADNKKTSENKDEVSGVKVATSANIDDDIVDDKKTSEDKAEVSGVKVATCANVGDEVVDNEKTSEESGIKMVLAVSVVKVLIIIFYKFVSPESI